MRPEPPPLALAAACALLLLAGCSRGDTSGPGPEGPAWVEAIGGAFGPRTLTAADVIPSGACPATLPQALAGEASFALPAAAACRLDVPPRPGLLVRPRALRFTVASGAVQVQVVQRGRGDSLTMSDGLAAGEEAEASFGKEGGAVAFACPAGCTLRFRP